MAAYGVLRAGGRVLLAHSSALADIPGRWYLPGGGIDFGETPEQCLIREFAEETGLVVRPGPVLAVVSDVIIVPARNERLQTLRVLFGVQGIGGDLRPEVHGTTDAVGWFTDAEAADLPLMPFVREALRDLPQPPP